MDVCVCVCIYVCMYVCMYLAVSACDDVAGFLCGMRLSDKMGLMEIIQDLQLNKKERFCKSFYVCSLEVYKQMRVVWKQLLT